MFVLAWSIFAVGGVYIWAGVPIVVSVVALTFLVRPQIGGSRETRLLDYTLMGVVGAAALQLVPLPRAARMLAFPNREAIQSALIIGPTSEWQPLSLDPLATTYALAISGAALLMFWTCRYLSGTGHIWRIATAIAFMGLAAALAAIAQQAGDTTKIYGIWAAVDEGARPFGPFVNRNHFATWVLMAIPLSLGYVVACVRGRRASPSVADEIASMVGAVGSQSVWVAVSAATMSLALIASTSRSGLLAFAVSLVTWLALGRRRLDGGGRIWLSAGVVVFVAFLASYARLEPLLLRAEETIAVGTGGRAQIWNETTTLIRDVWPAGTGLGSYQRAMLVYQTSDRSTFVNQAHNQYLQILAEGGLMIVMPALLAIGAFVRLFIVRLRRDSSAAIWLRVGGAAALIAVAVQSFWETGLRMPANAILFAVAAAIAVHRPGNGR